MNNKEQHIFRKAVYLTLGFTLLLWMVKGIEWSTGNDLGHLGILPRTLEGAIGIFTGPLVHGDFYHLLSNTFPIIFLGVALFYFYEKIAVEVLLWIYISTGLWVWTVGRDAYHIGASGVIYGVAAFILCSGILRKNTQLMALSLVVIVLYGGMVYGLFPNRDMPEMSWESHLLGAFCGVVMAIFFRRKEISTVNIRSNPMEYRKGASESIDQNDEWEGVQNHTYRQDTRFTYTFIEKSRESSGDDQQA